MAYRETTARLPSPPAHNKRRSVNEDAKDAGDAWLKAFDLPTAPAPGVKDLKGRVVKLCSFPEQDNEAVRFFFPRRSVPFLNDMVKSIRVAVQRRGGKIQRVIITPQDYALYLQRTGQSDTDALRFQFATLLPHVE